MTRFSPLSLKMKTFLQPLADITIDDSLYYPCFCTSGCSYSIAISIPGLLRSLSVVLMVVGYDKDLQRKSEARKSLHCINLSPLILLNNAAVPQGSWSDVFFGVLFPPSPRTGGSALISFEMCFLCLRRKRKTEKDRLFLWPIRGLTLIIIPVTD